MLREHYKRFLIKESRKNVRYLDGNRFKYKKEPVFYVYECGNVFCSAKTLEEAKKKVDEIMEEKYD